MFKYRITTNPLLGLTLFLLTVNAVLSNFLWSSAWILIIAILTALYVIFNATEIITKKFEISIQYVALMSFCLIFIIRFSGEATFSKESFILFSYERQYVEFISLILYFLLFWLSKNIMRIKARILIASFCKIAICVELLRATFHLVPIDNPQYYSYFYGLMLPGAFVDKAIKKSWTYLISSAFVVTQVFYGNRVPALAGILFLIFWGVHPYFHAKRLQFKLFLISQIFLLILFPVVYVLLIGGGLFDSLNSSFSNETNSVFDKGLDGRMFIWPDLLSKGFESPIVGLCSNCSTEYFDNEIGSRSISSHNTILEIFFRLGIVGLLFYIWLFISLIYKSVGEKSEKNLYKRFIFSYTLSSLYVASSNEFLLTQVFVANAFYWLILGLYVGNAWADQQCNRSHLYLLQAETAYRGSIGEDRDSSSACQSRQ